MTRFVGLDLSQKVNNPTNAAERHNAVLEALELGHASAGQVPLLQLGLLALPVAAGAATLEITMTGIDNNEWLLLGSGVVRPGSGSRATYSWCVSKGGSS